MESTRVIPIFKASCFVRAATTCKNQTEKNQAKDDNDLDRRQPEFKFSKKLNTEVIDDDNGDQKDCNEGSGIDLLTRNPVLKDKRCSCQVVWCDNNVLVQSQ